MSYKDTLHCPLCNSDYDVDITIDQTDYESPFAIVVPIKKDICPECGCSWDTLLECYTSEAPENRAIANVIMNNCRECMNEMIRRED